MNEDQVPLQDDAPKHVDVHITLAPGALDHVPLNALIPFLMKHNLVLAGTEIQKAE